MRSVDFSHLLRLLEGIIEMASLQLSNSQLRVACEIAAESPHRRYEQNGPAQSRATLSEWLQGFLCSPKVELYWHAQAPETLAPTDL